MQMLAPREISSPARLQRLANKAVNNLGLSLIDVSVEPRGAGQVAIVLPEGWAYLFLAHLQATAKQIQEQLRRAMYQAKLKDARMQEQLESAARDYEARQVKVQERYRALIAEGLTKREAIRQIKVESQGTMTATEVQGIVESADPRKKQARLARNGRIVALRQRGMKLREIAAQEGVRYDVVAAVLRKGGQDASLSNPRARVDDRSMALPARGRHDAGAVRLPRAAGRRAKLDRS